MKGIPGKMAFGLFRGLGLISLIMLTHTDLQADPPPRCAGYGTLQSFSLTDWESGLGDWTVGTHDVVDPDSFDTPPLSLIHISEPTRRH